MGRERDMRRGARWELAPNREGHVLLLVLGAELEKAGTNADESICRFCWWKAEGTHRIFIFHVAEARSSILKFCHVEG